ncbi:DUF305 domain-containing protein [Nonomuraea turcica]|uniref:DUF305 domain-containing protein n=1 Tax=Nonomuraea sp. G32 TaxID=3067274 RepID=UPI00273C8757|nr:DUF305 domain-containing protein [Nonomuraea sp. G32]MDP4511865.1 DUF305 domain-containing protein [Nonomuraea sp. G32]
MEVTGTASGYCSYCGVGCRPAHWSGGPTSLSCTQGQASGLAGKWQGRSHRGRRHASGAVQIRPMMRDLSKLSGDALDETFLQDMIPHHMMTVMMSQHLLMHGNISHPEVAAFAGQVSDAQHAEMFQMQQYMADWFRGSGMSCPMWGLASGGGSCPRPQ